MKVLRNASIYYLLQGVAVLVWWIGIWYSLSFRSLFILDRGYETSLLAFWLADISFIGAGSVLVSIMIWRSSQFALISAWFVTGAVSYAGLYCLVYAYLTDTGWLGVVLMMPAMILSGVFAVGMSFSREMFRPNASSSTSWIIVKTFIQIVVVWSIILVVLPYVITLVEDKLIPRLSFQYQHVVASVFFVVISFPGVWAAYTMSTIGKGTPLPLDHANKLVIRGPYAYVRNPMALSGIGQGLAVALFLGSPLVAAYALMGSAIWQMVFRPLEEDELEGRFGADYQEYRAKVMCWIPRYSPFSVD